MRDSLILEAEEHAEACESAGWDGEARIMRRLIARARFAGIAMCSTPKCYDLHHAKRDQGHPLGDCPVVKRWNDAIDAIEEADKL